MVTLDMFNLQQAKTFIAGSLGNVTELGQDEAAGTYSFTDI